MPVGVSEGPNHHLEHPTTGEGCCPAGQGRGRIVARARRQHRHAGQPERARRRVERGGGHRRRGGVDRAGAILCGEFLPVVRQHQRRVQVARGGQAQGALQQDLARGVGRQVRAAHDVGHLLLGIVDDDQHDHDDAVDPRWSKLTQFESEDETS